MFLSDGLLTTLQDLGRRDFRAFGVNPNGAMDKRAARLLNVLLGNRESEAVLEMHFPAAAIKFEQAAQIALGGADFGAKLNQTSIENWRIINVESGDALSFTQPKTGARLYLAARGGFVADSWLNSCSTNLLAQIGGFHGRAIRKNDCLKFKSQTSNLKFQTANYKISTDLLPRYSSAPTIRVTPGAEWNQLDEPSQTTFLRESFALDSQSNRMGFRLRGANLSLRERLELVSSAVDFGTIQLFPNGQLAILMADHQTTGGYPRIAHVAHIDLPLAAQLNTNDKLRFEMIPLKTAEDLTAEFETRFNWFKVGCKMRNCEL